MNGFRESPFAPAGLLAIIILTPIALPHRAEGHHMASLRAGGQAGNNSKLGARTAGMRAAPAGPSDRESEGEVDLLLKRLKKANVRVVERCLEKCKDAGGSSGGRLVDKPRPERTADARGRRLSGPVSVRVVIDEEGKVIAAQPAGGNPALREAAVAAARRARFSPTLLSGQPVKVSGVITYNFVLQ
jgi:TonB family protein